MIRQTTKTALITGANSGIGLELTKRLLADQWQVVALIRSDFPAEEAPIAEALQQKQLRVYKADLSRFKPLRAVLTAIKSSESHLDVLFNNAGVSLGGLTASPQGRDIHFEVNTLVPYLILMELTPLLLKGRMKTVVNTSSNALFYTKSFKPEALAYPTTFKKLTGPYAVSKLGLSLWTQAMAPSLLGSGITMLSVDPGGNKTPMTAGAGMPGLLRVLRHLFFAHPRRGATRLYEAAFGTIRHPAGSFITKGRPAKLPYSQYSLAVLKQVAAIYQDEYLNEQPGLPLPLA